MRLKLSAKDVNRLAQTFYEHSQIPLRFRTDKPLVVNGLRGVFAELDVEIIEDEEVAR